MNQITIVFTPCSPEPENGYLVFYREVGEVDFIQYPDPFTSSPIIFQVDGPFEQPYEGYIISDCGEGVFGPEVSWETVLCPPPPGCCDPTVIDAEAETIIPDGSGSESGSVGGDFLRLVFNVNMAGESLADWNAFFGFTFDNVVYSGGGTIVDLYLSVPLTIPANLFEFSTTLLRVLDFSNLVVSVDNAAFRDCDTLLEIDLPACTTIGEVICFDDTGLTDVNLPLITVINTQAFGGCTSLINFNAPLVEIVGISALDFTGMSTVNFPNCTTVLTAGMRSMVNLTTLSLPNCTLVDEEGLRALQSCTTINLPACTTIGPGCFKLIVGLQVLNLPVCSDLGGTDGDDLVFDFVSGENIVFTLLTATAGDTDVSILQANNSVTLILV